MQLKQIFFLIFFIITIQCNHPPKSQSIDIITGIAPMASLIHYIAGNKLTVTNVIPSDVDPHSFQLKVQDALLIENAKIVIAIDTHIDAYMINLDSKNKNIFLLNNESNSHNEHAHDHSHHHDHKNNSHLWLSYIHTEDLAYKILGILTNSYPEFQKEFISNTDTFVQKLRNSYQKIYDNHSTNLYVIQRHHAWNYLLEELDIPLIGTLEEFEGATVSVKKLVQLTKKINALPENSKVVLIDDAFSQPSSALEQLAKEKNTTIMFFNPMMTLKKESDIINILEYYSSKFVE